MLLGEGDRDVRQEGFVDLLGVDGRDDGEAELGAERVQDLVRVQEPLFDEDVGQALVALGLAHAGLFELLRREPGLAHEDLAELEARCLHPSLARHGFSLRRMVTCES